MNHTVRIVAVQVEPHPRRTRRGPQKQSDLIVLCTDLLELEPELVALIYRYRYTVEPRDPPTLQRAGRMELTQRYTFFVFYSNITINTR